MTENELKNIFDEVRAEVYNSAHRSEGETEINAFNNLDPKSLSDHFVSNALTNAALNEEFLYNILCRVIKD